MRLLLLTAALALAGCATPSGPEALRNQVEQLAEGRTGVAAQASRQTLEQLLARQPFDADTAVRIALLNNPSLEASFAALAITDAERAQAVSLPNPHFAFGRLREGQAVEIERMLSFNVMQLVTLPWRARNANRTMELARLRAAQDVIRTAAATRKAWIDAVAARQSALYLRDAREAAEAGAELARRMARVGTFSRLQQAREQATLADIAAQYVKKGSLVQVTAEWLRPSAWTDQSARRVPVRCSTWSSSATSSSTTLTSSPAACSSAWPSHGPWRSSRRSC